MDEQGWPLTSQMLFPCPSLPLPVRFFVFFRPACLEDDALDFEGGAEASLRGWRIAVLFAVLREAELLDRKFLQVGVTVARGVLALTSLDSRAISARRSLAALADLDGIDSDEEPRHDSEGGGESEGEDGGVAGGLHGGGQESVRLSGRSVDGESGMRSFASRGSSYFMAGIRAGC